MTPWPVGGALMKLLTCHFTPDADGVEAVELSTAAAACAAARRASKVGPSGTEAGRFLANSSRSVGRTSEPKRSSCSRTVFRGRPA